MTETSTAPGAIRRDARPPIPPDSAPAPGAVARLRRTVIPRPIVRAVTAFPERPGPSRPGQRRRSVAVTDPYVRRYWTAVIGPGAVADLLRLAAAARGNRPLPKPLHLDTLLRYRLVVADGDTIVVPPRVPMLPAHLLRSLHPELRRDHPG